jgi:hypothetical protein
MKNILIKMGRVGLMGLMVLMAATGARAQVAVAPRAGYFTNAGTLNITNASGGSSLLIAGSGTATVTSSNVIAFRGRGIALWPSFAFTNAGTDAVTLGLDVSPDGTNWSTAQPIQRAFVGNGTTGVLGYTNVLSDVLDNVKFLRLTTIANAHASSAVVTNVGWSVIP